MTLKQMYSMLDRGFRASTRGSELNRVLLAMRQDVEDSMADEEYSRSTIKATRRE